MQDILEEWKSYWETLIPQNPVLLQLDIKKIINWNNVHAYSVKVVVTGTEVTLQSA